MIKIYIWDNKNLVGHASLSIGKWYCSFHPKGGHVSILPFKQYEPRWANNVQEDIDQGEIRKETIELNGLDEDSINEYISDKRSGLLKDYPHYELYTKNCSTVVAHLLMIGYYHHLPNNVEEMIWKLKTNHIPFWPKMHSNNAAVCEQVLDGFDDAVTMAAARGGLNCFTFPLVLLDLFKRGWVWEPSEIHRMAHTFQKHQRAAAK